MTKITSNDVKVHKLMPTFAIYWIQSQKYKVILFLFFHKTMMLFFVLQQQYYCTDESRRLQDKPTSTELQYFDQQDSQVSCLWTFCQLPIFIFLEQHDSRISPFFLSKIRCYKTKRSHFTMFLVWLDRDKCTFCVHKRIIVFFLIEMRSTMILKPWT